LHQTDGQLAKVNAALERFGRYALLLELPSGGTAKVHVALKEGGNELCILKRLKVELRDHETAGKRLQREAHIAAHLDHRNIARVLDAGMADKTFFVASEYVAGQELAHVLDVVAADERRIPPEIAVRIALDVLEGLEHAHDAVDAEGRPLSLVHRDLTPRNLMVGFDGITKIIDFGSAKGAVDNFMSLPGSIVGTPRYLAPEVVTGKKADRRADLYALCACLFEMLTGKMLVPPGDMRSVLGWIITETPPLVSSVEPDIGTKFDAVIADGLVKDREKRWASAAELKDALSDFDAASHAEVGALIRAISPEGLARYADLKRRAGGLQKLPPSALAATRDDYRASDIFGTDPPPPAPEVDRRTEPVLTAPPFIAAASSLEPSITQKVTHEPEPRKLWPWILISIVIAAIAVVIAWLAVR
jgi:eukaryotic-like serine/threonine-protein kinase